MFSRIALALVVAGAFQMTALAGKNAPINRLPSAVTAADFQEDVPVKQLPSAVTAAIKNRFPKAELLMAERDVDNGRVVYEVIVRSNGQIFDVDVTPNGRILKIDRED
jgi:uncharacterized membrane protein YkoI